MRELRERGSTFILETTDYLMSMSTSFIELALEEAKSAALRGEVPVGAVLVDAGQVIASNGNRTIELNDPSAHAEILVIREACCIRNSQRLPDCDLYVTLEPCTLCAAAISFARIRRVYFCADDEKGGAVTNGVRFFNQETCHHAPEVYSGFSEVQARNLLQDFFATKRIQT